MTTPALQGQIALKDLLKIIHVLRTVSVYGYGPGFPQDVRVPHPVEAGRLADLLERQLP